MSVAFDPYQLPERLSPLRFTNRGNVEAAIGFVDEDSTGTNLSYKINGGNWNIWDFTNPITLQPSEYVEIAGVNNTNKFLGHFDINTSEIYASGNLLSILLGTSLTDENILTIPFTGGFINPFNKYDANLKDSLFNNCKSLKSSPLLTAINLSEGCYLGLFSGCSSLIEAPKLPATTLANYCYGQSLGGGMFCNCTSLTQAPELPATTLVGGCYTWLFYGCTSLTSVTCKATDMSASISLVDWTRNISTIGTLYVDPSMINENWNIPSTWTVQPIQS